MGLHDLRSKGDALKSALCPAQGADERMFSVLELDEIAPSQIAALADWCILDLLDTGRACALQSLLFLESLLSVEATGSCILHHGAVTTLLPWASNRDSKIGAACLRTLLAYVSRERHCEQSEAPRIDDLLKVGLLRQLINMIHPDDSPPTTSSPSGDQCKGKPATQLVQRCVWSLSGSATVLSLHPDCTLADVRRELAFSLGAAEESLQLVQGDKVYSDKELPVSSAIASLPLRWVRCSSMSDPEVLVAALRLLEVTLSVHQNRIPEIGKSGGSVHLPAAKELGLMDSLTHLREHESVEVRDSAFRVESVMKPQKDGVWWLLASWLPLLGWVLFLWFCVRI